MTVDIDNLRYAELQRLAKKHGIKANKKASKLKEELKILLSVQESESTNAKMNDVVSTEFTEKLSDELSFKNTNFSPDGQDNKENIITSSPASDEENSVVLNRTYELPSPVMCSKKDVVENPAKQYPDPRKVTMAKKPSVIKTVPDFSKIHAKAASKLESLVSYASRHKLMNKPRPPFASPPFVTKTSKSFDKSKISLSSIPDRKFSLQKFTPMNDKIVMSRTSDSVKRSESVFPSLPSNKSGTGIKDRQANNSSVSNSLKHKTTTNIPADSAFARRKAYDLQHNQTRRSSCTPHRVSSTTPKPTDLRQDIRTLKSLVNIRRNKVEMLNVNKQNRFKSRQLLIDKSRGL
ncbi:nucleolar and spindle-associated 1 [Schistosoma japonicum]|nr:nucleolar and spindle-associated 1 [Schistosoma japonicum]